MDEGLVWWCGWVRVGVEPWWTISLELALLKIGLGLVGEELQLMNDVQIVHWCFSKNKEKVGPFAKM